MRKLKFITEDVDPFMDSYTHDLFACHAMIDNMRLTSEKVVDLTVNKDFLIRILYSHVKEIRKLP